MSEVIMNEESQHTGDFSKQGGGILTFLIEDQIYGMEISHITDIIEMQPITVVPKVPSYIKGVINLRGKVIPVMNVRARFGKEIIPYDERTCIIVVEVEDLVAGLIIDRVSEVVTVSADTITPPPDYKSVNSNRFIKNIVTLNDEIKLILDCKKLIMD